MVGQAANYAVVCLTALAVILMICWLVVTLRSRRAVPERGVGKSMTIGDREYQEDDYAVATTKAGTLLVLADGMGKAYGGKTASHLAVNDFINLYEDYNAFDNPQYYFRKAFSAANRSILKVIEEDFGHASVTAALIQQDKLYYAAAGNVRIAVCRGDILFPVTEGHTIDVLASRKFHKGDLTRQKAAGYLQNHRLYNFVGQDGFQDIEYFDEPIQLKQGDIVLVMSDGVYELLTEREIELELQGDKDCQRMAYDIIERVNGSAEPGKDNASVIVYRV